MSHTLFNEFREVSAKEWKQKIQFDLKGADYNETLIFHSKDGISVKPFYNAEDLKENISVANPTSWNVCEKIYVASDIKSNIKALEVLNKGAESLWFVISSEKIDFKTLFKNVELNDTPIYISFEFLSEETTNNLISFLAGKEHKISLQVDIIGNLARSGNWYHDLKKDHEILNKIVTNTKGFESVISVDGTLYQNAGATIPQELAYMLAHANEYLNHFNNEENTNTEVKLQFLTATGSNYFFEIAKLKAFRLLFSSLASEYKVSEKCSILAQPSKRDKTLYDYNVNLLRTTTQSMSAVLGGADEVYNSPYDAIYHKNNEFGDRIARNQLLVLKNESYFDKVSNASDGAYYIESLTLQFAEKALEIFKEIENAGGFLKQLKEGIIQRKIAESATKEQELFDAGKITLIGTNKFQNPEDRMAKELELYPFLKMNPRKTLLQPILERRLSERSEQERLKTEQ
ncbi:heterodimeric methylmalonyl-CoA mutase small subunit [Gillisia mitskevichiae]|uniref:Heterodimeric methylmalonyl-CoA mutase small subunit n=1 Tax=Gillisia mitskevichiae TaxID=270921 RepID=A0A495PTA0_9FLAO|nr:methylmalonyl-CoA mutase subunit beta [Gillisia mitskevichiae]RKS53417.1 heterodimeric methylmalonyl-CoA mutase small subunit [Gillisia mitskevichiae]